MVIFITFIDVLMGGMFLWMLLGVLALIRYHEQVTINKWFVVCCAVPILWALARFIS